MDDSQSMILYSDAHPTSEDTAWEHTALVPSGGESIEQALTRLVDEQASLPGSALTAEHLPQDYYQPSRAVATRQYSGVPTLTADGKVNPAWLDSLTLSLGLADSNDSLKAYGNPQQIGYALDKVHGLLADPGRGTLEFMQAVYDTDTGAYTALIDEVVRQYPDRAASLLQQSGYLGQKANDFTADELSDYGVPWHLIQTAQRLPQALMDEYLLMNQDVMISQLEREAQSFEMQETQQDQWRVALAEAEVQGERSIQWLSSQYEQAHWAELRKWRPHGSDEESNERARFATLQGAYFELRGMPHYDQMFYQAHQLLSNAPMKRLNGQSWEADDDEAVALQLAQDFNRALGAMIEKYINVFGRGGSSKGAPISSAGAPPTLDKNGKINPAWLNWLARKAA